MRRRELSNTYCPIGRASAQIVDGWTFVILRELVFRNARFNGLLALTKMSPRSLSQRLKTLEENGILSKTPDPGDARGSLYDLTVKGQGLWPILISLNQWGTEWCGPWDEDAVPVQNRHRDHDLKPVLICADCGEAVSSRDVRSQFSQRYVAERQACADK